MKEGEESVARSMCQTCQAYTSMIKDSSTKVEANQRAR